MSRGREGAVPFLTKRQPGPGTRTSFCLSETTDLPVRKRTVDLQPLAGLQQAQAPRGSTSLQTLIGFLLLFRGDHGLACIAAFPDSRPRDEFRAASPALFRHRLL